MPEGEDTKQEDHILEEMSQLSDEIVDNIATVIEAEWDAPTLQKKIASQVIEYRNMRAEFSEIFEKRTSEEKE